MYKFLFIMAVLPLCVAPGASAKDLGAVKFFETESAYFYEKKVASGDSTVFFQPKLTSAWGQIAVLDQGKLWQINLNFRSDVDFESVKKEVPDWNQKIFVRDSIVALSDCLFTPDVPGRFKAKLKHSTAGKTFAGMHLCQFEVMTKHGDSDILSMLQELDAAGTLISSGLEKISLSVLEPDMQVSVEAVHQLLLPHSSRLRFIDQTTAHFALILAVGSLKGEVLLSVLEKVEPDLISALQNKLFESQNNRFTLRDVVEDEAMYLGFRSLNKEYKL
jgi:hypothetical protein